MKRRGRPPLDPSDRESVNVHFRIPARHYEREYARAREARVPISEWFRRRIGIRPTAPGRTHHD
jgi:hypothetical protein